MIVHCGAPAGKEDQSSHLVLDYVTDKVLKHTPLGGSPFLSPDARYLVTVETDGNTISVSKLKDDGKHILYFASLSFFSCSSALIDLRTEMNEIFYRQRNLLCICM